MEDPAVLVTKLDLDGCIRLPQWNDGPKVSLFVFNFLFLATFLLVAA